MAASQNSPFVLAHAALLALSKLFVNLMAKCSPGFTRKVGPGMAPSKPNASNP